MNVVCCGTLLWQSSLTLPESKRARNDGRHRRKRGTVPSELALRRSACGSVTAIGVTAHRIISLAELNGSRFVDLL